MFSFTAGALAALLLLVLSLPAQAQTQGFLYRGGNAPDYQRAYVQDMFGAQAASRMLAASALDNPLLNEFMGLVPVAQYFMEVGGEQEIFYVPTNVEKAPIDPFAFTLGELMQADYGYSHGSLSSVQEASTVLLPPPPVNGALQLRSGGNPDATPKTAVPEASTLWAACILLGCVGASAFKRRRR
ncbi:MAG: hypothetical protein ACFBZ8_10695 [Opitutales bacterium]